MRSFVTMLVVAVSILAGATGRAGADAGAELVSTAQVWDRADHVTNPDLIRFGDRWFLVCEEGAKAAWQSVAIRILTSDDGQVWKSAALIESPTPKRGLFAPTFLRTPAGGLTVLAEGFVGWPQPTDPVPEYGGTRKTMAWNSLDGRVWGQPKLIAMNDFPLGRVVWHNDTAFTYAIGRICGSIQTVHIMTSRDGQAFESHSDEFVREILPYEGEVFFNDDTAYCVLTGSGSKADASLLGTAEAPYTFWKWKKLDQSIRHPRFVRLPGGRVIAACGLFDEKTRTSLCEFHPATGNFTELLELPTGNQAVVTGLAWHAGHVWVAYSVADGGKARVDLAKVKLK